MSDASPTALARTRVVLVILLLVVVFVAMMLTSHAMSDLRVAIPRLSRAMSWLEGLNVPFDMDHVAFFSGITFAARLLLPRVRWWWIALAVALLAGGTELIQFWVPGRTPKLMDVRDDLIGGAVGLVLGALVLWLMRLMGAAMLTRRARVLQTRAAGKP